MILLLLADEQESMIAPYLERGEMFVLEDNGVKAVCELKSIAVIPDAQRPHEELFHTQLRSSNR